MIIAKFCKTWMRGWYCKNLLNFSAFLLRRNTNPLLSQKTQITDDMDQSSIEPDPLKCKTWLAQKKHIFVLSQAGKPIYSRHSSEDKLVTVMGVMQALVSFVQDGNDMIRSIHAGNTNFVFLLKGPLILVSVSKTCESVPQLVLQLTWVHVHSLVHCKFDHCNKYKYPQVRLQPNPVRSDSISANQHLRAAKKFWSSKTAHWQRKTDRPLVEFYGPRTCIFSRSRQMFAPASFHEGRYNPNNYSDLL